jgi:hypothetical protein
MNGSLILQTAGVATVPTSIVGTGDFNGDGTADLLWRNTIAGDVGIRFMNCPQVTQFAGVPTALARQQRHVAIWFMFGTHVRPFAGVATVPRVWSIRGANAD